MYRYWLTKAYKLALYGGGRRRSEVAFVSWPNVIVNKKTGKLPGGYVEYRDLKVERGANAIFRDEKKINKSPITQDFADLLISLGWETKKKSKDYIIAPEITNRNTVKGLLTRCFIHYYIQIDNPREEISFDSMRKTYYTYVDALLGGLTDIISGHGSKRVLKTHYIDPSHIRNLVAENLSFKEKKAS